MGKRLLVIGAALVVGATTAAVMLAGRSDEPQPPAPSPERPWDAGDGPLADGDRVDVEEAERRTPYDLRIPPANEATGELTDVWIDATSQVAFVWSTNMRFYVATTDLSERVAAKGWNEKVTQEPRLEWQVFEVDGHTAIGRDGQGERSPSGITWIDDGLSMQFVAPNHTLDELKAFAESVTVEGED